MHSIRPLVALEGPAGFAAAGLLRRGGWRCATLALLIALPAHAHAAEPREGMVAENSKLDTEMMFGFLVGTDIGTVGEKEFESETNMGLGKRGGSYGALAQTFALEYIPIENLRIELGAILASHAISSVPGLDDRHHVGFQGLSFEMRYRLIDRERYGFGLALLAEPHWGRFDESDGQPVNQYGAGFRVMLDKELLPDRIVGAFNLIYDPDVKQSRVTGDWSRESNIGLGAGLMARIRPDLFLGGEARYLRAYDSLGLDIFAGHALFVGPNLYYQPFGQLRVSASWSMQVAGRAVDDDGALDLTHFTRHQVRLKIGYEW
ncbi:MAG: hypothetical protein JO000_23340 [Alphaproteobacteria bacterium]|nr:hypothetical protein [Alphaproteobacteria bacterium]